MPSWTLLLALLAAVPLAASADDAFETRCSVCHGADASGGGHAPSILGFVRYHTDAEISELITNGRADKGMPAFSIPAAVMPALIAHLRELAGSNPAMGAAGLTGEGLKKSSGRKPGAGPKQGKLQLADNRVLEGLIVSEDDFSAQILTGDGNFHLLAREAGASWYNPDPTNIAPRVAAAWSPTKLHDKTVIRVGGGIFYGQGQFGHLAVPLGNMPQNFTLLQTTVPGLSFPVTPYLGAASYSVSYSAQDRNRKNMAVDEWSFSIQQELAKNTNLTVSYIGSEGSHLWTNTVANGVNPATGTRPYTGFSNITYDTTNGVSNFHALEVGLHRDLRSGLLLVTNYQWSHAIDDGAVGGAEATTPDNQACRSCERASSMFDMRSYFTSSLIWQVPVGRGRALLSGANPLANALLGGWQLAGVGTVRSGLPLNVTISRSASALPDQINSSQRPNIVPGEPIYPAGQSPSDWLNVAAFSVPANGAWGNAGRDLVRAPGHGQMDVALEKRMQVRERMSFTFRAEAFNVLNVAQLGNPVVSLSSKAGSNGVLQIVPGNFGLINGAFSTTPTGSGTPREIELSLRLDF